MTPARPDRAPSQKAAPPSFCWGHVAAKADRDWLERQTDDLVGLAYRRACDAVRMGVILIAVGNRLPGHFVEWVNAKAPCSLSHAYRLIAAAKAFAPFVSQIEKIDASALYLLSHESVPPGARAEAVRLADAGERVTRRLALDILDANRPVRAVQLCIDFGEAEHRELNLYRTADGKAVDQQKVTAAAEAQDAERLRKVGAAVLSLFERADLVTFSKVDDADDPAAALYSVSAAFESKALVPVVDRDPLRALQRAAGAVEWKFCAGCRVNHTTDHFGCNRRMPDGLMSRCKTCERARKAAMRAEKRARRSAEAARGGDRGVVA